MRDYGGRGAKGARGERGRPRRKRAEISVLPLHLTLCVLLSRTSLNTGQLCPSVATKREEDQYPSYLFIYFCLRQWEGTDDLVKSSPVEKGGHNSDVCWLSREGEVREWKTVEVGSSAQKLGHCGWMWSPSGSFPELCSDNLNKLKQAPTFPYLSLFPTQHRTDLMRVNELSECFLTTWKKNGHEGRN